MSEMQRTDDVGAVLRLLPHFLRLEMHQLRRDHRSHDFQQSKKEPGRAGYSTGVSELTINRVFVFTRFDPAIDASHIESGRARAQEENRREYSGFLISGQNILSR